MAKLSSTIKKDVDSAPPDELGHFTHHFSITMELEKHPWFFGMAIVAVILLVIYVLRHGILTKAAANSTTTNPTSVVNTVPMTNGTVPVTVTNPVSVNGPVTVTGTIQTTKIRSSTGQGYDANYTGVPYYNSTTSSANGAIIPFGTLVTILASGIPGTNNANGGQYTQIRWSGGTGYVATQDISNV